MTDSEKEKISIEAQNLRLTAKHVQSSLLPKMGHFKDHFKDSEWLIIESAMNNYAVDISQRATRLEIIAQQPF